MVFRVKWGGLRPATIWRIKLRDVAYSRLVNERLDTPAEAGGKLVNLA